MRTWRATSAKNTCDAAEPRKAVDHAQGAAKNKAASAATTPGGSEQHTKKSMNIATPTEKQKQLLRDFGARCYWHGEDTGDYAMSNIDDLLSEMWQAFSLTLALPAPDQMEGRAE